MNRQKKTILALIFASVLIWNCFVANIVQATNETILDYAIALNNAFEHRMCTGEGQMTITLLSHKIDQLAGTTDSEYVMNVKFVMDDKNILMDIVSQKNVVEGKEQPLKHSVVCEDDRFRKEYHEDVSYAYVYDKSVIKDGDIRWRPDPRYSFRPNYHNSD